jgi:nicotinamidase/pyrazinamidase
MRAQMQIQTNDVLLVIDVQNDFCPGGALAVGEGDAVVPVINALTERFDHVVLTQDWHPAGHSSFASVHSGSAPFEVITMPYGPQAFYENDRCTPTGLAGYLRERGFKRVFLAGLATDYCVYYSAVDARREGFEAIVIESGCRAIDLAGSLAAAWAGMAEAGVQRVGDL